MRPYVSLFDCDHRLLWSSALLSDAHIGMVAWELSSKRDAARIEQMFRECADERRMVRRFTRTSRPPAVWFVEIHYLGFSQVHTLARSEIVPDGLPRLTKRQAEVCLRLARGERTAEIGQSLNVAKPTIDTHVRRCRTLLNAQTMGDLIGVCARYAHAIEALHR